jgi:ubiquinone/menaquinone biosynthesis C-methylase UbiE
MKPAPDIRADFDRIARLSPEDDGETDPYLRHLLRHAPDTMTEALEVGCGTGAFTRQLARRAERVVAVDLSPAMIEVAQQRSASFSNIEYLVADATTMPLPAEAFHCIASIATLHHMPLRPMLARLIAALRPGGLLLVMDLSDTSGPLNLPRNALAWFVSRHARRGRGSPELAHAYADHGRGETYARIAEIRAIAAELMPGAAVADHLLWRYSIVWRKPRG